MTDYLIGSGAEDLDEVNWYLGELGSGRGLSVYGPPGTVEGDYSGGSSEEKHYTPDFLKNLRQGMGHGWDWAPEISPAGSYGPTRTRADAEVAQALTQSVLTQSVENKPGPHQITRRPGREKGTVSLSQNIHQGGFKTEKPGERPCPPGQMKRDGKCVQSHLSKYQSEYIKQKEA